MAALTALHGGTRGRRGVEYGDVSWAQWYKAREKLQARESRDKEDMSHAVVDLQVAAGGEAKAVLKRGRVLRPVGRIQKGGGELDGTGRWGDCDAGKGNMQQPERRVKGHLARKKRGSREG